MPSHVALNAVVQPGGSVEPELRRSASSNRQPPRPRSTTSPSAAEDDEVDVPVAVDVDRVRAGDRGQVGDGRGERARSGGLRRSGLSLWYSAAGSLPPARNSSSRPSSSQSNAATPPPTKYSNSPS